MQICGKRKFKLLKKILDIFKKNNFDIEYMMFPNFMDFYTNLINQYKTTITEAVICLNNEHRCLSKKKRI